MEMPFGFPAEAVLQVTGVDGVAEVVAFSVRHKGDEFGGFVFCPAQLLGDLTAQWTALTRGEAALARIVARFGVGFDTLASQALAAAQQQCGDAVAAFKTAMRLVDVLRRQKAHMEAVCLLHKAASQLPSA